MFRCSVYWELFKDDFIPNGLEIFYLIKDLLDINPSSLNPNHLALHTGSDIPVYAFYGQQADLSGKMPLR